MSEKNDDELKDMGKGFWERFDKINKLSIKEFTEKTGINYKVIAQQRFEKRLPRQ